jgi:hypothetical protein
MLKIGYQPRSTTDYLVAGPSLSWLTKNLRGQQPVHILLAGAPATDKSLFLEARGRRLGPSQPYAGPPVRPA